MLQRCIECVDYINGQNMVYCMYCQDAYHSYCLVPPLKKIPSNRECIVCRHCKEEQNKSKLRQLTMDIFTKKLMVMEFKKLNIMILIYHHYQYYQ